MPPHTDDVTTGELMRRFDEMRSDVRQLSVDVRQILATLPQQFIPRAELDERRHSDQLRITVIEDNAKTQVSGRRWAIGLCSTGLLSLAGIAIAAAGLAH